MARGVRIALIMGGGVSLGSFSGGALGEALRLLEGFPATRSDGGGPAQPLVPKIDVVTGASAGSMTLGIMLRQLLAGRGAGQVASLMRESWVEGVGIDYRDAADADKQLLPDLSRHRDPSLLSTRPIQRLADRLLAVGAGTSPQPSPLLADPVYVSFAVANLHGVDVRAPAQLIRQPSVGSQPTPDEDAVVTTFHDDQVRFRIEAGAPGPPGIQVEPGSRAIRVRGLGDPGDPDDPWSIFRSAAIASGSFPAAFPPVPILRRRDEFGRLWPEALQQAKPPVEAFRFQYVDGGTFRNEPLREAIQLAALRDDGSDPASFERVFILIDPNVSGASAALSLDFEHPLSLGTSYDAQGDLDEHELERRRYAGLLLSVLGRVVTMIKGQSAFRDWLRAAKLNSRVDWEGELRTIVAGLGDAHAGDAAFLAPARALLERIYLDKLARGPIADADAATRAEAERRRDADLAALAAELAPGTSELALTLVLAIRNAAGLRRKRQLNLVAISPWSVPDPPIPLAGNFLANFGGFFDERWRAFDYRAGQFAAHHVLTLQIGSDVDRLIRTGAPAATARPDLAELAAPGDTGFGDVAEPVRDAFLDVAREHVENLAHALGVPNGLDDLLSRFARGRIEKALRRPSVSSRYLVVRITGAIEDEHELKRSDSGKTGEPHRRADGSRVLETIVEVQKQEDAPLPQRYRLVGPHLLRIDGTPQIRVMRDTLLSSPKERLKIRLNGGAEEWWQAAERRRLLEIAGWDGTKKTRSKRPRDLKDFGPAPAP